MKTRHLIIWLGCLLLALQPVLAENKFYIPETTKCPIGETTEVSIWLDNTDAIVGLQFELELKYESGYSGALPDLTDMMLTDRGSGYILTLNPSSGSRVKGIIYSASNKSFTGNSGALLRFKLKIPESTDLVGKKLNAAFTKISLSKGSQSPVRLPDLTCPIEIVENKRPNFAVENIQFTSTGTIQPGGEVTVSWQVKNAGNAPTEAGWKESLFLTDGDETDIYLGEYHNETILPAGNSISRTATVKLNDYPGIDGNVYAKVILAPYAGSGELEADKKDNEGKSSQTVAVAKKLTLNISKKTIAENSNSPIQCYLYRSGKRTNEESFSLEGQFQTGTKRFQFSTSSLTIPAGQSGAMFTINAINNNDANWDSTAVVVAKGNDYPEVKETIRIEDDERPYIRISLDKNEVKEGGKVSLTVEREWNVEWPLTVNISSDHLARFESMPSEIVIDGGQTSATIELNIKDDKTPAKDDLVLFTASAPGHYLDLNAGDYGKKRQLLVKDDDVPKIKLSIIPSVVSESAGSQAAIATIEREGDTDNEITVKLTDNSKGRIYYPSSTLTFAKGESKKEFAIGIQDDETADNTASFTLTAAVYFSSCSCSSSGTELGVATQAIEVIDDDNAAIKLSMSKTTIPEGGTAQLTVSVNSSLSSDLTLKLATDNESLAIPTSLVIKAGTSSAVTEVQVKKDDINTGSRVVAIRAEASGFSVGSCWFTISDQSMPDALISSLSASDEIPVNSMQVVEVVVKNDGVTTLPQLAKVTVYLSSSKQIDKSAVKLGELYTGKDLAPGESEMITNKLTFPDKTGDFYLIGIVNEDEMNGKKERVELSYSNNISSSRRVTLTSLYRLESLSVDKPAVNVGGAITVKGQMTSGIMTKGTGSEVSNVPVDLYIMNGSYRKVFRVITDASGVFTKTFVPDSWLAGRINVGACYPEEDLKEVKATFDLVGFQLKSSVSSITLTENVAQAARFKVTNPNLKSLSNVKLEVISKPAHYNIILPPNITIGAGQEGTLEYTITPSQSSTGKDWEPVTFKISAEGGLSETKTINCYTYPARARLSINTEMISTTVTTGGTREVRMKVTNNGAGETGRLTVALPDAAWLKSVTPLDFSSLKQGESVEIILNFLALESLPSNAPISGTIAINSERATGLAVPFSFKIVSETNGSLVLDVCDEYTYYQENGPHVADADVVVKNPYTNAIVRTAKSGEDGLCTIADLPGGEYTCVITKSNHEDVVANVVIEPDKTTKQTIMLMYTPISYTWKVERTEMDDVYNFSLDTKFETNVPAPVVVITVLDKVPDLKVGESAIVTASITNHGLVSTSNLKISVKEHDYYSIEPLIDSFDKLPANSSVTVPLKVTRKSTPKTKAAGVECTYELSTTIYTFYNRLCNFETGEWVNYQIYGELELPNLDGLNCKITVPDLPDKPRVISDEPNPGPGPDSDPGSGPGPGPGPEPNSKPVKPGKQEPRKEFKEETEDCAVDCMLSGGVEMPFNYAMLSKDLKDLVEKCGTSPNWNKLSFAHKVGTAGAYLAALQLGWDIGEWLKECYLPYLYQYEWKHLVENVKFAEKAISIAQNSANKREDLMKLLFQSNWGMWKQESALNDFLQRFFNGFNENGVYPLDKTRECVMGLAWSTITEAAAEKLIIHWGNSVLELKSMTKADVSDDLIDIEAFYKKVAEIDAIEKEAQDLGYKNSIDMLAAAYEQLNKDYLSVKPAGCTTISISFPQKMIMTREAFEGTLTINNPHPAEGIEDIVLNLQILDEEGNDCTHLFHIDQNYKQEGVAKSVTGVSIKPLSSGTYSVLYIPYKEAAPEGVKKYRFTGTLSYKNPFSSEKEMVSNQLYPVLMEVQSTPNLRMTYFVERDIMGDNPLTSKIEPMEEAEFALLVNNIGVGEASNIRIATQQPKITDNKKDLDIEIKMTGATLNGSTANLPLGKDESVLVDFGTIPGKGSSYAQWWFTSSLLGHFIEYDVKVSHVTSSGDPKLSLLDTVTVHELIHSFRVPSTKETPILTGFLVNDIPDLNDEPDMVYLSDGSVSPVTIVNNVTLNRINVTNEYSVTVPNVKGWSYGCVAAPQNKKLVSIDDAPIDKCGHIWQTNWTIPDGLEPKEESKIHIIVNNPVTNTKAGNTKTYKLKFEDRPETVLAVESITGLPKAEIAATIPVEKITVKFNKAIQTLSHDKVILHWQGEEVKEKVTVSGVGDTWGLDLSAVTKQNGCYVLTILTSEINDTDGFIGSEDYSVVWNQLEGGKVSLTAVADPEKAGTVTPTSVEAGYGEETEFKAKANKGYLFKNWTIEDRIVSTEETYSHTAIVDQTLVANFAPISYKIEITYDAAQGFVSFGTGYYEYDSSLELIATPNDGYRFVGWFIGGNKVSSKERFVYKIIGNAALVARFEATDGDPDDPDNPDNPDNPGGGDSEDPTANEEMKKMVIQVYPTRVADYVHVGVLPAKSRLILFNLAGKQVKQVASCEGDVDMFMGDQPSGVYLLYILAGEEQKQTVKLIKK